MTLTVVSGSGLAGIALAVQASDAFAVWIIDRSTVGTNFGDNLGALLLAPLVTPTAVGDGMPAMLVILLGVAGIVTSCVQIILMIVRSGMLVILAGIFPLSASFTTTETGRTWFRRCCAWLLAFILYKPAAAIVYATAFRLAGADLFEGSDGGGMLDVLVGVTMMVLAILALPALMRFVTPAVSAMSSRWWGWLRAGGGRSGCGAERSSVRPFRVARGARGHRAHRAPAAAALLARPPARPAPPAHHRVGVEPCAGAAGRAGPLGQVPGREGGRGRSERGRRGRRRGSRSGGSAGGRRGPAGSSPQHIQQHGGGA